MIKRQKKPLPIGIDDFKKVQEGGFFYTDKTALIKELLTYNHAVTLMCRPRRFGKTLNLSMLSYFFDITKPENKKLFISTALYDTQEMHEHQGAYPVIFLTFKNIQEKTYDNMYDAFKLLISREFLKHELALLPHVNTHEKNSYQALIHKQAGRAEYASSLFFLSRLLAEKYKKNVVILLDEYDAPIHAAYTHGYYNDAVDFLKTFLGSALKGNVFLERAVLTGILRTAKEGIFSGLNNLTVCTVLEDKYADCFGFTEQEVIQLLATYELSHELTKVRSWYNGYAVGEATKVYNPWSLLNFVESKALYKPYWVNTASNTLLKQIIANSPEMVKQELESLLSGNTITKTIDEGFTFQELATQSGAVWALLLLSGYLTWSQKILQDNGKYSCVLCFPNYEIKLVYVDLIESLFNEGFSDNTHFFYEALFSADIKTLAQLLQKFVVTTMGIYDLNKKEPEKSYHLFVLGLLVTLEKTYRVTSNRQSGFGRYDIMLIPYDRSHVGILIEFKRVDHESEFQKAAQEALKQIKDKNYALELKMAGVDRYISYAMVFAGTKVYIDYEPGDFLFLESMAL